MDDIIALLAREAGKKFAEAQKAAAADAVKRSAAVASAKKQAANTWGTASATPGRGAMSAGKTAAPAPVMPALLPAPPLAVAPPAPPAPDPLLANSFVVPDFQVEPPHPSVALLAAFSGGPSLLSGIVLAEALAPPIALRAGQLFDRLAR